MHDRREEALVPYGMGVPPSFFPPRLPAAPTCRSLLLTVLCGKPLFWKGRLWRPFPSVVPATGGLGFCPGCV